MPVHRWPLLLRGAHHSREGMRCGRCTRRSKRELIGGRAQMAAPATRRASLSHRRSKKIDLPREDAMRAALGRLWKAGALVVAGGIRVLAEEADCVPGQRASAPAIGVPAHPAAMPARLAAGPRPAATRSFVQCACLP